MGKNNNPDLGKSIIRRRGKNKANIKHADSWVSSFTKNLLINDLFLKKKKVRCIYTHLSSAKTHQ